MTYVGCDASTRVTALAFLSASGAYVGSVAHRAKARAR